MAVYVQLYGKDAFYETYSHLWQGGYDRQTENLAGLIILNLNNFMLQASYKASVNYRLLTCYRTSGAARLNVQKYFGGW